MLLENIKDKHIILASKSPRRQKFLKDLGLDFEIRLKEVAETYPLHLKGFEITDYLSKLKAIPFMEELNDEDILITSDTIVWLNGKAIGKPKDRKDAITMLQKLSDNFHEVFTSISITSKQDQLTVNDNTKVYFKKLTLDEITYYIDRFKPYDKAGSYGIQEWIGFIGIEKIEGSYFNVMGFPTQKFYEALQQFVS